MKELQFLQYSLGIIEDCPQLSPSEWKGVFDFCLKQSLLGIGFGGVERLMADENYEREEVSIPKDLLLQWFAISEQIKKKNEFVNGEIRKFAQWMVDHDFHYRIVKGQVVALSYHHPMKRQSGDVDFWVYSNDYKRCEECIEKELGVIIQRKESIKHVEYQWQGIQYELHSHLATFSNDNHQKYFDNIVENDIPLYVTIGNADIPSLSPTLNALYLFIHIFHHLIGLGVGLRQFCDWMLWLHRYNDKINRADLESHLNHLNLLKAYRVLGAILVDELGLPRDEFPFTITEKDKQRSRVVLRDVLSLGSFGHSKDNIRKLGFLHSVQTGIRMFIQGTKYLSLAPQEILLRLPKTVYWYLNK